MNLDEVSLLAVSFPEYCHFVIIYIYGMNGVRADIKNIIFLFSLTWYQTLGFELFSSLPRSSHFQHPLFFFFFFFFFFFSLFFIFGLLFLVVLG
jgi:hypothetical protein